MLEVIWGHMILLFLFFECDESRICFELLQDLDATRMKQLMPPPLPLRTAELSELDG
eukprot:SAG11_NODE_3745_length_2253_cov_9.767874_2_plen_57_part_00